MLKIVDIALYTVKKNYFVKKFKEIWPDPERIRNWIWIREGFGAELT